MEHESPDQKSVCGSDHAAPLPVGVVTACVPLLVQTMLIGPEKVTGSLKVTLTAAFPATLVARLAGVVLRTEGAASPAQL